MNRASAPTDVLAGWTRGSFSAASFTRDTYRRGSGPGVVVIHEVPGITPSVAQFANEVVAAGFTVIMPSLLGEPGKAVSPGYIAAGLARLCIAQEFTTWAQGRTSPIVAFLRALARALHDVRPQRPTTPTLGRSGIPSVETRSPS